VCPDIQFFKAPTLYYTNLTIYVCLCREKEEDLEKRQFFLNRELRPLMEIPGWCYIMTNGYIVSSSSRLCKFPHFATSLFYTLLYGSNCIVTKWVVSETRLHPLPRVQTAMVYTKCTCSCYMHVPDVLCTLIVARWHHIYWAVMAWPTNQN